LVLEAAREVDGVSAGVGRHVATFQTIREQSLRVLHAADASARQAVAAMKLAQQLDPPSLVVNADVAEILDFAGHADEAIEQARKTIEMEPNFAITHYSLGERCARQGRDHEALQ
jgi:predicted Zn-dependent protease